MAGAFDRAASPESLNLESPGKSHRDLDESTALTSLKELISAGDHRLDPILGTIADAARQLTGASGAALAMWKDGEMVCRARSGQTAPVLGARLSADTGISGECLRTGKVHHCADTENDPLVDLEVCRSLGLRAIAVLPIQGWRGINGILEVFSTKPGAFSEPHLALLQQLAALAERARATQPHGASSLAPKKPAESAQASGLLPASDRVGDVALAFLGTRSRPLVLGAIGLVALSLLGLMIWLGWRGPDEGSGKAHAAGPSATNLATSNNATPNTASPHPPDNDAVWKANPGGETLFQSTGKTSAGTPVQLAAKVEIVTQPVTQPKTQASRSSLLADVAANVAVPHESSGSRADSALEGVHDAGAREVNPSSNESVGVVDAVDAASISSGIVSSSALSGVLSAKNSLPGLATPVSQGVSGGQLIRRVAPVYPAQARLLRLEGKVILAAVVMEDGNLRDVKVVEGSPVLAPSAVEAVKRWRYKPFELDGKPVKNEIQIRVDFKLPSDAASR